MKRAIVIAALLVACGPREKVNNGDPDRGKQLIEQYGCPSCHVVPGIKGPKGVVGPSLDKIALRTVIAGKVQNTPQNMSRWLQNPQAPDPGNAMPNLGITPVDARDITAYLFTLK
jgi:cytochrome c2